MQLWLRYLIAHYPSLLEKYLLLGMCVRVTTCIHRQPHECGLLRGALDHACACVRACVRALVRGSVGRVRVRVRACTCVCVHVGVRKCSDLCVARARACRWLGT